MPKSNYFRFLLSRVYGLAVKRLLEEYGLSSGSIKGTGRPNRLLKGDVLAHIQSHGLQRVAPKIGTALNPCLRGWGRKKASISNQKVLK